jgi:hypothetical protein
LQSGERTLQKPERTVRARAATPHNLHTPIAAERIRRLFPDALAVATLKEPVWRMRSAFNQFGSSFLRDCAPERPAAWCPVFRYYQLALPSWEGVLRRELAYLKRSGAPLAAALPSLGGRRAELDFKRSQIF